MPEPAIEVVRTEAHAGSVTAARDWGAPAQRRRVRPSIGGSWERLFHDTQLRQFLLILDRDALRDLPARERALQPLFSGAA
jgi:erythromycin esterase-like protein